MLEYLIVGVIVAGAALYVLKKYLPKPLRARLFGKAAVDDDGCGSDCGSCGTGCGTPTQPDRQADAAPKRVIKLHSE